MSRTQSTGNAAKGTYMAPSKERALEKKLVAVERRSKLVTDEEEKGLEVKIKDIYGDGAVSIQIAQEDRSVVQLLVHRELGTTPIETNDSWALSNKSQATTFAEARKNPYEAKAQQSVKELKTNYALLEGLLLKDEKGQLCYPGNLGIREKLLGEGRQAHVDHKKVQGAVPLVPTFAYCSPAVQEAEVKLLNGYALDQELNDNIDKSVSLFRSYKVQDQATGLTQHTPDYLKGIPKESLADVLVDVLKTGNYNAPKWDPIKVLHIQKEDPYVNWGYEPGNIPQIEMKALHTAIAEHAKALKAYEDSKPKGKEAKAKETAADKEDRAQKHQAMQAAAKKVNIAEKFEYKLPKRIMPMGRD